MVKTYKVYLTVHFETEIQAVSLEQAEALASGIDYVNMHSYDESDFRVEEVDSEEV